MDSAFLATFLVGWLAATLRLTMTLVFGALGAVFSARAGILNIAIEGMMLVGAFTAAWASWVTGSPVIGILLGAAAGGLLGLLLGFMSIVVRANQVVTGTVINLFALGITSFLLRVAFGFSPPSVVPAFAKLDLGVLSDIPFLGPILFSQTGLVYVGLLLVPVAYYVLFRTPWGLSVRAVGENPAAADAVGVNVARVRYACVLIGGLMAGLGGGFLTLGHLSVFMENVTSGKGFIALAALTLGKWNPVGALGACLVFGAADALQLRLQAIGIQAVPVEFLQMFPYVAAMVALAGLVGRAAPPAAMGKPYVKGEQ